MEPRFNALKLLTGQSLSRRDCAMLLATARRVARDTQAGTQMLLLHNCHLALISFGDTLAAASFREAGEGLGAQVANVDLELSAVSVSASGDWPRTARVLSRLYDAVECQGVPAPLVQNIANAAGMPVFDGLACPEHFTAVLVSQLDMDVDVSVKRRLILQAVLLAAVKGFG